MRLRQGVLVAADLEPAASALRGRLGLLEPFRDPGVGEFGLENVVFALGDCFLEVVSPVRAGTAAGRYLDRHGGDGGYMVIFDVPDLAGARERAAALGIRTIWQVDLPDISATHLHPADMNGAIVSIDHPDPPGTWRWGGPEWTGRAGTGAPARLSGASLAVADPPAVAARWGEVLGIDPNAAALACDGGEITFVPIEDGREGLVELTVAVRGVGEGELALGAVRVRITGDA